MIKFPSKWADTHGMRNSRVEIPQAVGFVNHVQSFQFGYILEHKSKDDSPPIDSDPAMKTEKELQENFEQVKEWLQHLEDNGQETISTRKVLSQIEDETGYEVEFTD